MAKMKTVSVNAYAKVNFTLDILGREGGYHLLDSLVSTVSLFDSVTATARTDGRMNVFFTGVGAKEIPSRNNALRAAEADGPVFAPGCGRGNRVSFAQDEEGGVFYVSSVCAVVSVRRNLRFFLCLCVFSGVLPLFDCFVKRGLDNLKVLNNLFGFTLV